MPLTQLAPPYPIFTDKNGDPLDAGYLYFGEVNKNPEANPIQVYYDRGLTQPVAQPVRTSNGYVMRNGSPALIYADGEFSVTVRNKNSELVIYSPVGYGVVPVISSLLLDNAAKDVSALIADTSFSYDISISGSVQVAAGDILRTLAEGFAYEVAASGAADQHVTTAGGVKLYVQPVDGKYYPWAAWGPVADGVTDNYAKLRSAGDACYANNISGLQLPSGRYYISQEFVVNWQGWVTGAGGLNWANNEAATSLYFPEGTNGIRIPRGNTQSGGTLGDWSRVQGVALICVGDNTNSTGHGVVLDARAYIQDVYVNGFPEDGFHVEASATGSPSKNANSFIFYYCRSTNNGRDGMFFKGADANAGSIISCDCGPNGRFNYYDRSFLGNYFFGCHSTDAGRRAYGRGSDNQAYRCKLDHVATADTIPVTGANWTTYWELAAASTTYPDITVGTKYYDSRSGLSTKARTLQYVSDNANSNTSWVSCYAEGTSYGGTSNYISNDRKTVIGGAGMITENPRLRIPKGITYLDNANPVLAERIETSLGGTDGQTSAYRFQIIDGSAYTGLIWSLVWDNTNKIWNFGHTLASSRCYQLIDASSTSDLPAGVLNFTPQGVGISGKIHIHGAASPTSGTWRRGDRIYQSSPSAGGTEGWICTTAGVAGSTAVFKTFGSISA